MTSLFYRDIKIMFRDPKGWLISLVFLLLFLSLFAISQNGDLQSLQSIAPAIIWLGVVFSLVVSFEHIFQRDLDNGQLEQLRLSGISLSQIVMSKLLSGFLFSILPMVFIIPIAGIFYNLSATTTSGLALSILIGAPSLMAYAIVAAALLSGHGSRGFLMSLIVLPFVVPVLIFALEGIEAFELEGLWNTGFQALFGVSIIAVTIAIPAASAALAANMD